MIRDTLLVSCPGATGGLFVVHGRMNARVSSRPITGICVGDGQLVYAYQDNGGQGIKVIIDGLAEERLLADEPLDLHDLLIAGDHLYAAVTESNRVACFDKNLNNIVSWTLPGEHDSAHLNSVTMYQGELLASVFGRFHRHRQYKEGTQGLGEVINIQSEQTFIGGLSQPHSLTVVDDLLYLCNSEARELRIYRGQELLQEIPVAGYARGLAVGEKYLYVGISRSRNAPAGGQTGDNAAIAVIDRATLRIDELFQLPTQEIYDIRIINRAAWVLPHILEPPMIENSQLQAELHLITRESAAYKAAHGKIVSSLSWKIMRPFFHLETRIRKDSSLNQGRKSGTSTQE